jgi:hypothetical protein
MLVSVAWNVWIMVGGIVTEAYYNTAQLLPLDVSQCVNVTSIGGGDPTQATDLPDFDGIDNDGSARASSRSPHAKFALQ